MSIIQSMYDEKSTSKIYMWKLAKYKDGYHIWLTAYTMMG